MILTLCRSHCAEFFILAFFRQGVLELKPLFPGQKGVIVQMRHRAPASMTDEERPFFAFC